MYIECVFEFSNVISIQHTLSNLPTSLEVDKGKERLLTKIEAKAYLSNIRVKLRRKKRLHSFVPVTCISWLNNLTMISKFDTLLSGRDIKMVLKHLHSKRTVFIYIVHDLQFVVRLRNNLSRYR